MVKTRVHDLAAEFGVAPEQLLSMLKDMNIFVRSHLSALESDQVSAVRVRWEREKRKSAEEPTAKKGRRKAVKAEPAPAPRRGQADQAAPHGGRSRPGRGPGAGGEGRRAGGARAGAPVSSSSRSRHRRSRSRSAPAPCSRTCPPAPVEPNEEAAAATDEAHAAAAALRPSRRLARPTRRIRHAQPGSVHSAAHPAPGAVRAARPEAGIQQQRAVRALAARRAFAAWRPVAARRRPRRRAAGQAVRPRRGEGRRPEEGEEGQAVAGGSGRRAGQHPEDPAGHEGPRGTEGRAPQRRAILSRRGRPAASRRRRSARRPGSG